MLNRFQLYLSLARASNLPTVWTNAVAAWAVAGMALQWWPLLWLSLAGSLLYAGGCTLNDAFDAKWDAARRPERPIPSGKLSAQEVWLVGLLELGLGLGLLGKFGFLALGSGLLVVAAILLYDWLHKKSPWAVLLMGWCRFQWGTTAWLAAGGTLADRRFLVYTLFLFGYIVFISLIARQESRISQQPSGPRRMPIWRIFIMGLILLFSLGREALSEPAFPWAFGAFILWLRVSELQCLPKTPPQIGRFVGRALAGITLLDTLFACLAWSWSGLWLALMLPLCLLLQRRIAAT
jgi:4-hydroxybenzoate polyprenyltransferase